MRMWKSLSKRTQREYARDGVTQAQYDGWQRRTPESKKKLRDAWKRHHPEVSFNGPRAVKEARDIARDRKEAKLMDLNRSIATMQWQFEAVGAVVAHQLYVSGARQSASETIAINAAHHKDVAGMATTIYRAVHDGDMELAADIASEWRYRAAQMPRYYYH